PLKPYLGGSVGPTSLVAADFDGDGHPDLAASGYGTTLGVLIGLGDGTFAAVDEHPTGHFSRTLVAADLDGDGDLDLAVSGENDGAAQVFLNDGTGAFGPKTNYAA